MSAFISSAAIAVDSLENTLNCVPVVKTDQQQWVVAKNTNLRCVTLNYDGFANGDSTGLITIKARNHFFNTVSLNATVIRDRAGLWAVNGANTTANINLSWKNFESLGSDGGIIDSQSLQVATEISYVGKLHCGGEFNQPLASICR